MTLLRNEREAVDTLERGAVDTLGRQIGYGRVMQLCEELWADRNEEIGLPRGGAHSTGPCVAFLVTCRCREPGSSPDHCDWCCGAGRVTKRVREVQDVEFSRKF